MNADHTLGIFEAGISQPGEMEALQTIIQPTVGLITNIGNAHDAGFTSHQQKLLEKLKLFKEADIVIGSADLLQEVQHKNLFSWSKEDSSATLHIKAVHKQKEQTEIEAVYKGGHTSIHIPFTDDASVQNAINCWCILLHLNVSEDEIKRRFKDLHAVDMRLQLKHAVNDCLLINDSYSADITSLKIALEFLQQQSTGLTRTVILSEFVDAGSNKELVYEEIASLLKQYRIQKLIVIGEEAIRYLSKHIDASISLHGHLSTADFVASFRSSQFFQEIILLKGARTFELERIAALFEKKVHQTVLQISLNALVHNLREYQKLLKPETKVMAMVKAFSYGSGGAEIASVLQYHNVHYLGVAYADEGVELVKAGIHLPIMVLNVEESTFHSVIEYNLQPVIYSKELMITFEKYLSEQGINEYPVHLELETGMHRLGFAIDEMEQVSQHLAASALRIQSVFSHLAASEDPNQDDYTKQQGERFQQAVSVLQKHITYPFIKHIANSAAILRHPDLIFDMVRLGIGLYGIETVENPSLQLQAVATLRSTVAQIKEVKKGESVSYNRRWIAERDSVIATIRIGYADGYSRRLSNGRGKMWLNGTLASVVGTVCMDMTMIDITDMADVREGDEVIVFGEDLPVQQLAQWMETIPYEVITGISQRVKRVYYHE